MRYTAFANKAGIFMNTDALGCTDWRKRHEMALLFQNLIFREITCGDETYEVVLDDDIPSEWVHAYKNADGTEQIEIRADVCAVPEQLSRGLTIMRLPVWSEEPVGIPLWKCVTVIPRAKVNGMQEE